ncbi:DEAD/DEAH box helicase, partial [Candidatus Poribacteria bacterium]|nr:DEAD/DEAH box helicase [Candidatus Poribacteria bacterium]
LGIERISQRPWQAVERAIQRLLVHAGFDDVRRVGGRGDGGGDVVANYKNQVWIIQSKFRSGNQVIGAAIVDELVNAVGRYGAEIAVLASNAKFSGDLIQRAKRVEMDIGTRILLWDGELLLKRFRSLPEYSDKRNAPRPYQEEAIEAINSKILYGEDRGLLLMATGLGKTRVAAGVIEQWVNDHPKDEVLVIAPSLELVPQLEAALWPYLPKGVATHVLIGSEKPSFEGGVTVATVQSMLNRRGEDRGRFGLVVVDEAHHAPADGYKQLLSDLSPRFILGMTATPWRGDERRLEDIFGEPTSMVTIVEGMQLGYLARVDYRMMVDTIDWNWVRMNLSSNLTIRELNRRLFIPERDDALVSKIREHLDSMVDPRAVLFCRSIDHAESIAKRLKAEAFPVHAVHSRLDRFDTTRILRDFRSGDVPIIVTVDMLNEGIDIPDVNLIAFLRVTHSRRIFVQQLGRGLRLSPGKGEVRVLDFVSDVRRIAAARGLNAEGQTMAAELAGYQVLRYPDGRIVKFEGDEALSFFDEYLRDVAELEEGSDDSQLKFPTGEHF